MIKLGLKISPHKCQFFRDQLTYMGFSTHAEKCQVIIYINERKYDAVIKLKLPKSVKDYRSFCGMVNILSSIHTEKEKQNPIDGTMSKNI